MSCLRIQAIVALFAAIFYIFFHGTHSCTPIHIYSCLFCNWFRFVFSTLCYFQKVLPEDIFSRRTPLEKSVNIRLCLAAAKSHKARKCSATPPPHLAATLHPYLCAYVRVYVRSRVVSPKQHNTWFSNRLPN